MENISLFGYKTEEGEYIYTDGVTFSKIPIGDITIEYGNKSLKYCPQEDITSYELSKLLHLFVCAISSGFHYEFKTFIDDNNLIRHFEEVK